MNKTEDSHWMGELVTFNEKLIALAGFEILTVEVMENKEGQWKNSIIPPIPLELYTWNKRLALVVTESGRDSLFYFGTLSTTT